jgi:superfamily II DNA or RNA helicase
MIPRHYQKSAHDATWQYLSNQSGEPLIVLPTGAGKSLVIAMLVEQARKFDARVIVLQHRKELIEQNAEKIQILLPDIKIGIYSAGLNSRDTEADVVCAGIQSVHSKAHEFGRRELILIDEVHLVSGKDDSMYGKFLADIRAINPRARMVGLTATPFRTGEGPICGKDKLFQRICYEAFTGDLIREGWLCPVTNKPADATVDTSKIKRRGSEFVNSDMARAFDSGDKVELACGEIVAKCHDRHSVLVFSAGVEHAEHVAETLRTLTGERVGLVTGDTMPIERVASLSAFKAQELRWLVNCDVLTTGFDAPCIDAIAVLRATMSPGLFAQIVGRGLRNHESKTECIAEGQRVLTDSGLIEIQNVTTSHKVWDGVDFVSHDGIVLRGESHVITYAGLTATEDHDVWTKEGWKSFGECANQQIPIAVTGNDRSPIKLIDCYFREGVSGRGSEPTIHGNKVRRMRESFAKVLPQYQGWTCWMQEVWKKTKFRQAMFRCSEVAVDALHCCKVSLLKLKRSEVARLRGQGDSVQLRFAEPHGSVVTRQHQLNQITANRSNRQRRSLRSGEPPLRHSIREHEESESLKKTRVWDILNAGPRHRFTCEGLLVCNCKVLDFGGNIARHGSIDDPNYGRATAGSGSGSGVEKNGRGKACLNCGIDVPAGDKECPECGFRFPDEPKDRHDETSDDTSTLTGTPDPETWEVLSCAWGVHVKKNAAEDAPRTLRVDYTVRPMDSGGGNLAQKTISEWVCFEHSGFARTKAEFWWQGRSVHGVPTTIDDAVALLDRHVARVPSTITTQQEGKYERITAADFTDLRPEESEWLEVVACVEQPDGEYYFDDDSLPF